MKKLILIAGLAALSACMGKAPEAEETTAAAAQAATATATPAAAAPGTVPAATTAGSYDVTYPDGTKSVDTLMADGSFVSRDAADKVVEKGKWAIKDGKTCFTIDGQGERCFTESARAADGSFTATGTDGKSSQVKPHTKM